MGLCHRASWRSLLLHLKGVPSAGFWNAAWLTSTFFGAGHTGNNGENWIGIFAAAFIGFVFCVSIWVTGSAWWAIGCHAAWELGETYFYGTADSGFVAPGHLLSTSPAGTPLWSRRYRRARGQPAHHSHRAAPAGMAVGDLSPTPACRDLRTRGHPTIGKLKDSARLWLNRTGDVSLREQLITQVVLGILSRELAPGQRLPSTRDLSRRFGIHANTASAAYRQLESEGWVETRHGSGVFVRTTRPEASLSPEMAIDQMIGDLAAKAQIRRPA